MTSLLQDVYVKKNILLLLNVVRWFEILLELVKQAQKLFT